VLLSERWHRVRTGILERLPAVAVGLGFLAALWPFVRLDFDRNHDGFMLTVAIAHHAGLNVHGEVASQYGPLPTWTQELFLHLPIAPAFSLRIWTVLLLAGTAATIADLGRVAPHRWRLNLWTSSGAAVVWVLMCDRWLGITLHPWSSVLAAFLTAVAMHCWVRAEAQIDQGRSDRARRLFTLAGIAIGLSPFARINVGLSAVVGTLTIALLTHRLRANKGTDGRGRIAVIRPYALGLCIGLLLPILRLGWTRSLGAYVDQSILSPLQVSGTTDWQPRTYLENVFRDFLPLVLILVLAVLIISRITGRIRAPIKKGRTASPLAGLLEVTFISAVCVAIILWSFLVSGGKDRPDQSLLASLANWEWGSYTDFFFGVALVGTAFALFVLVVTFVLALVKGAKLDSEVIALMIAGALGLAGLTQIYPTHDSRHIWWGIPMGLLAANWGIQRFTRAHSARLPLLMFAVLLATTATTGWRAGIEVERFSHPSTVSSAGFMSSVETVGALKEDVKLLKRTVGHSMPALFFVYDYDLPTLLGNRILPDKHINADGFTAVARPNLASRLTTRPPLIVDNWDPDMKSLAPIIDFMRGTDYFLSARSPTRVILVAPPCINGSCEGIDPDEVCMAWGSCRPRSFRTEDSNAVELPAGEYLDADAVVPVAVFDEGFISDQRSGRWFVDRLAGNPVLVEWPAKVPVGERWITGQRAVLRFTSGELATPTRMDLVFRTSPSREVEVHVLTTAQQKSVTVGGKDTKVQVLLDANSVQEVVIRCESFETSFASAPDLPVCAELIGMTLHE
jgi:hypothetical protein